MYKAKNDGRGRARFFQPSMQEMAEHRLRLENDLRHALQEGQMEIVFQPEVDASGHIMAVEALLRWHHPQRGTVYPAEFIPVAEETGQIHALGRWAFAEAMQALRLWKQAGLCAAGASLAINLSRYQLEDDTLGDWIQGVIEAGDIAPGCVMLEITESALMPEVPQARAALRRLGELGVRLALDDFGTGYSSLGALRDCPVSQVKIDRGFVENIERDPCDARLVETIILMAHHLGLTVVGEGVETEAQAQFLRQRGCDMLQGFLFDRPLGTAH
jgi:EAL domain-containing protein (putative c-di-GMP-specific phosphodiesterase class I)